MKRFKVVLLSLFVIFTTLSVVAQDRIHIGADYGRPTLKPDFDSLGKDSNSLRLRGSVRVAGPAKDGIKLRLGYELEKTYGEVVFHDYNPAPMPVPLPAFEIVPFDIERDVYTHYGFAELGFRKNFFGVSGVAAFGFERPHEDKSFRFTRKYQVRGNLYLIPHVEITPLFVEYRKQPVGFAQGFGSGASIYF